MNNRPLHLSKAEAFNITMSLNLLGQPSIEDIVNGMPIYLLHMHSPSQNSLANGTDAGASEGFYGLTL